MKKIPGRDLVIKTVHEVWQRKEDTREQRKQIPDLPETWRNVAGSLLYFFLSATHLLSGRIRRTNSESNVKIEGRSRSFVSFQTQLRARAYFQHFSLPQVIS